MIIHSISHEDEITLWWDKEWELDYIPVYSVTVRKFKIKKYDFPDKIKHKKKATDYLSENVPLSYYLGVKGFEWVTQREKHQGRSRTNRDIIGCQTANQQFNWTGDFRIETPTNEMRENDRIYKCMYQGEYKVASPFLV